jgi:hypothetical protein
MEKITQGQVVKVATTADRCVRLTIDIDEAYAEGINFFEWVNNMVALQLEGNKNG